MQIRPSSLKISFFPHFISLAIFFWSVAERGVWYPTVSISFLFLETDLFPKEERRNKGIIFLILPNSLEAFNESLKENEALPGII